LVKNKRKKTKEKGENYFQRVTLGNNKALEQQGDEGTRKNQGVFKMDYNKMKRENLNLWGRKGESERILTQGLNMVNHPQEIGLPEKIRKKTVVVKNRKRDR